MRLARPFYRLPVRFDADRLRSEAEKLPAESWSRHPQEYEGNTAARLITVGGTQNDSVGGEMLPTPALHACPYLQQVLASFRTVWSRSRLMRLSPGRVVPQHSDVNYHWFYRVRVHVPIVTHPEVQFWCDGESVHMAAGEAWIFDNWRQHRVENPTDITRIHLVADTTGTSAFWSLVAQADTQRFDQPNPRAPMIPFAPAAKPTLLLERYNVAGIMSPAEVEQLAFDLLGLIMPADDSPGAVEDAGRLTQSIVDFCRDWRSLWSLFNGDPTARIHYEQLVSQFRAKLGNLPALAVAQSGVSVHFALDARLLAHLFGASGGARREAAEFNVAAEDWQPAGGTAKSADEVATGFTGSLITGAELRPSGPPPPHGAAGVHAVAAVPPVIERPLIILSAPRAGSTLLFETLAQAAGLFTIGGESHELIESIDSLRPAGGKSESNRLTAEDAAPELIPELRRRFACELRDRDGTPAPPASPVRMLEKTPKNALRVPFLLRVFPDAQFVFLHRDPRANLSSMMQAWRSGRWVTYRRLPGWEGSWSLLLPPDYQKLRGRQLEEIVAAQWRAANETILDDLVHLPQDRWTSVRYEEFVAQPRAEIARLLAFAGLRMDTRLDEYLSRPLPLSRYTLSPPDPEKWRRNAAEIERVMPELSATTRRLGR